MNMVYLEQSKQSRKKEDEEKNACDSIHKTITAHHTMDK